jgi:hypothetical protein
VPVRQWVLSFLIPLRILFAAHPQLLTPLLRIIHRVIARFLIKQAGFKAGEAHTGAVTLIQRFGSAANLNIHLHCLVLDGVYRINSQGAPVFQQARAPSVEELQSVLAKIITRLLRLLTRRGYLVEEQGMRYLAEPGADDAVPALTAAASGIVHLSYRHGAARGTEGVELAQPCRAPMSDPHPGGAPTRTASACTLACAAALINAENLNTCAGISPAQRSPTHASSAIMPAKSCCS